MPTALILIPSEGKNGNNKLEIIENIRKKYDKHQIPAHITLCYLHDSYDILGVERIIEKTKKFKIKLSGIVTSDELVYIDIKDEDKKKLYRIVKKMQKLEAVKKVSKSGFHLTLGYEGKDEKVEIPREIIRKVKTPIILKIGKIWLMRKKEDNGEWYRAKTFYLLD